MMRPVGISELENLQTTSVLKPTKKSDQKRILTKSNKMENIKLGYIPLAKANFDTKQAAKDSKDVLGILKKIDQIDVVSSDIVILGTEVPGLIKMFKKEQIDALLVHFCTFCLGN